MNDKNLDLTIRTAYPTQLKMTSLKKLLPKAFKYCEAIDAPVWIEKGEITNSFFLANCLNEIRRLQEINSTQEHFEWVLAFSKAALYDVIALKSDVQYKNNRIIINFIQFCITLIPLNVLAKQKKLQESYDWIAFSFCDDLSSNQIKEFEIIRLEEYMTIPQIYLLCSPNIIANWVGDFYYICRALSAIHDVAKEIYQNSLFWIFYALQLGYIEEFVWSISNMVCWGANNHDERTYNLVQLFEQLISTPNVYGKVKFELLICLSTVASFYSSKPSHEWAQLALEKYIEYSEGHQKLHLLLESCPEKEVKAIQKNLDLILCEIKLNRLEIIKFTKQNSIERLQLQDRLSDLLTPFIGKCISLEVGNIATEILKAWYQVENHIGIDSNKLLLIFPCHADSLRYCLGEKNLIFCRDLSHFYENFTTIFNMFLGVSNSIQRTPKFNIHTPDSNRFGIPDESKSKEMEQLLVEFYALDKLKIFINESHEFINGFICLPSQQHSFQYLCQKYIGKSWPLSASLETPLPDRTVINVCIWCGAGSITEEIESNVVKSVLEKQNIRVDYFSSDKTTLEEFKSIYESDKYDVIWIMSHGEFNHWKSGNVSIEIGESKHLSLDEILKFSYPKSDNRRLLFLNVCDGATYSNIGGIAKLGFAPALSNRHQCVISHLWPVNPLAAATFGVLYSVNIAKSLSFFAAFQKTLDQIKANKEDIVNLIHAWINDGGELENRIINANIEFELMIHSGSANFFE